MNAPRASIIIATSNRAAHLQPTLLSLCKVSVPQELPAELILADNGSSDETRKVFDEAAPLLLKNNIEPVYLFEPKPGACRARNAALHKARGEIIFITDDDVRAPENWVTAMSAPIIERRADAVAGGVRLAPHLERAWMTPLQRGWLASTEDDKIHYSESEPGRIISANMAFHRRVLEKVSGFDEELGPGALGFCDDILFSLQLKVTGFKIAPAWNIEAEHHFDVARLSRPSLLERARKEGRSTAYLWYHWQHMPVPSPKLKALYFAFKLAARRTGNKRKSAFVEGCDEAEMLLESKVACYQQYSLEAQRPRLYNKHGIVKKLKNC